MPHAFLAFHTEGHVIGSHRKAAFPCDNPFIGMVTGRPYQSDTSVLCFLINAKEISNKVTAVNATMITQV